MGSTSADTRSRTCVSAVGHARVPSNRDARLWTGKDVALARCQVWSGPGIWAISPNRICGEASLGAVGNRSRCRDSPTTGSLARAVGIARVPAGPLTVPFPRIPPHPAPARSRRPAEVPASGRVPLGAPDRVRAPAPSRCLPREPSLCRCAGHPAPDPPRYCGSMTVRRSGAGSATEPPNRR